MTTTTRTIRIPRSEKIAKLREKRTQLEAQREAKVADYAIHRLPHMLHAIEATTRLIVALNDRLAPLEDIEERQAAQQARIDAALALPQTTTAQPTPARKPTVLDMIVDWQKREGRRSAPQQLSVF
jgi:hypothetical protein